MTFLLVPALLALGTSALALTKDEVLRDFQRGIAPEVLIEQIRASGSTFSLSDSEVRTLVSLGMPQAVIDEMRLPPAERKTANLPEPVPSVESVSQVARLHAAGEPAERIIGGIEASPPFRVTTDELDLLKMAGVPDDVVAALARRSLDAPRQPTASRRSEMLREWNAGTPPRAETHRESRRRHRKSVAPARRGVVLGGTLGINACIKDSTAECTGVGPGAGIELSFGFRFSQWVSLTADLSYGGYSLDEVHFYNDDSFDAFAVMPTVRVHLPASPRFDITGGLGVGYASFGAESGTDTLDWSTFVAFKLVFELSYRVSPVFDLGVAVSYTAHPDNGEVCVDEGYGEACGDVDGALHIAERLIFGLRGTMRFE